MEDTTDKILLPFNSPTTIAVIGPTQSGKSRLTKRLVENASKMFTETLENILYAYSEYQPLFDDMKHIHNLTFHEGLPDKQKIEDFTSNDKHTLIILDDLISEIVQSQSQVIIEGLRLLWY